MGKREERLAVIRDIVRMNQVHTQAELAKLVAEAGFECTQATISRDISDLGLEKRRARKCYALPEEAQLELVVMSAASAGNMVVVRTTDGAAAGLAAVLDAAALHDILGSVAGDNTVMMVARTPEAAEAAASYIAAHKRKDKNA